MILRSLTKNRGETNESLLINPQNIQEAQILNDQKREQDALTFLDEQNKFDSVQQTFIKQKNREKTSRRHLAAGVGNGLQGYVSPKNQGGPGTISLQQSPQQYNLLRMYNQSKLSGINQIGLESRNPQNFQNTSNQLTHFQMTANAQALAFMNSQTSSQEDIQINQYHKSFKNINQHQKFQKTSELKQKGDQEIINEAEQSKIHQTSFLDNSQIQNDYQPQIVKIIKVKKSGDGRNARSDIRNKNIGNELSSLIGGSSKNRPVKALDFMAIKHQDREKEIIKSKINTSIDSFTDIKPKLLQIQNNTESEFKEFGLLQIAQNQKNNQQQNLVNFPVRSDFVLEQDKTDIKPAYFQVSNQSTSQNQIVRPLTRDNFSSKQSRRGTQSRGRVGSKQMERGEFGEFHQKKKSDGLGLSNQIPNQIIKPMGLISREQQQLLNDWGCEGQNVFPETNTDQFSIKPMNPTGASRKDQRLIEAVFQDFQKQQTVIQPSSNLVQPTIIQLQSSKYVFTEDRPQTRGVQSRHGSTNGARSGIRSRQVPKSIKLQAISPKQNELLYKLQEFPSSYWPVQNQLDSGEENPSSPHKITTSSPYHEGGNFSSFKGASSQLIYEDNKQIKVKRMWVANKKNEDMQILNKSQVKFAHVLNTNEKVDNNQF